jgi:hypothetical protein
MQKERFPEEGFERRGWQEYAGEGSNLKYPNNRILD